jgi:hypothetical protein
MPYIDTIRRDQLNGTIEEVYAFRMRTAGELTYVLTAIIERYRAQHGDQYQTFADIEGSLQGTAREFARRVVAPYEDRKRADNGDVYAPLL